MPKSYRAYAKTTGRNSWTDRATGQRQFEDIEVEDVVAAGEYTGDEVEIDAGDTVVTKVVFYEGEGDDAVVTGSVDIGQSGKFTASLIPPAP